MHITAISSVKIIDIDFIKYNIPVEAALRRPAICINYIYIRETEKNGIFTDYLLPPVFSAAIIKLFKLLPKAFIKGLTDLAERRNNKPMPPVICLKLCSFKASHGLIRYASSIF